MSDFVKLSKEEMNKKSISLKRDLKKVKQSIQAFAENAIAYSYDNAYIHYGNMLINELCIKGSGIRRQAIINMLEKEGCFKYNEKNKAFDYSRNDKGMPEKFMDWTEYDKENEVVSSVDVDMSIRKFFKSMEKKVKEAQENHGTVIGLEKLEVLEEAFNFIGLSVEEEEETIEE